MKLTVFLHHQWIAFWRSRNANKSLALQIILGIFYLFIFVEVAGLGIVLPFLIRESFPKQDPITLFCSYIIYYFLVGLLARFQFQELPSMSVQPYLSQNIKRTQMIRFLNARSLVHFINFLPLFVFIPFTVVIIAPAYGIASAVCFLIVMFALVLNNHFLNLYIKRKSVSNSWWFLGIVLFMAAVKALDYFKLISFEKSSAQIFIFLLHHPILSVIPVAIATTTFLLHNNFLSRHLYVEELVSESKIRAGKSFSFLNRFGDIGDMIALELKLISRNKRPKSLMILSAIILLYGFIFYPQYLRSENYSMLFLFALLITGLFISNYGQFLFAWQSSHFDGMMSYNFNVRQYIRAKFSLLITVCTLQFLVAGLYGFMNWIILPIQLTAYLYSIGVNSFMVIYVATYNYKYLNLNKRSSMNFQGAGAAQWLQSLFISFGPALIFFLLNKYAGLWVAIVSLSSVGILGLALNRVIIGWLVKQFMLRKYKILEGFRER